MRRATGAVFTFRCSPVLIHVAVGGRRVALARVVYDSYCNRSLSLRASTPDQVPLRVTSQVSYHSRSREMHLSSSSSLHACKEE